MHIKVTDAYLESQGLFTDFLNRFWSKVEKTEDCWIWTARKNRKGYGEISKGNKTSRNILAHRASWIIHFGTIPKGKNVLHNCPNGDRADCIRPDRLWLGTIAENNRDMFCKQRNVTWTQIVKPVGEINPAAKLTWDQVRNLREDFSTSHEKITCYCKRLSSHFGVHWAILYGVLRNQSWVEK